ncbi:MAG: hypothetical protein HDQ93_04615 [Desulfovibrio sp.]|nr:hypothetical protein [Desulfovibrio sp.]
MRIKYVFLKTSARLSPTLRVYWLALAKEREALAWENREFTATRRRDTRSGFRHNFYRGNGNLSARPDA